MKIERKAAVGLLEAVGVTTAHKWDETRLGKRLNELHKTEGIDELQLEDKALNKLLAKVLEANEEETEIEVSAGTNGEAKKPAKKEEAPAAKKPAKKAAAEEEEEEEEEEEVAEAEEEEEEEEEDEDGTVAAKPAKKPAKKEDKKADKKPAKKEASGTTRDYACGYVLGMGGPEVVVDEDLVGQVNTMTGKSNDTQTKAYLAAAMKVVAGYRKGQKDAKAGVKPPATSKKPATKKPAAAEDDEDDE